MKESKTLRLWWQKPKKTKDLEDDRKVSFLELFYDLVYVVIISELTHALAAHVSWAGVLKFSFLFVFVWWAWVNGALYHELHGNNDIRTRFFTFVQMIIVAFMAVFAHNAMGSGFMGFAFSYAAFLAVLAHLWWRTGVHDPLHKPFTVPYVWGFLISVCLFIASPFVTLFNGVYLWVVALLISLLLPLHGVKISKKSPEHKEEFERSMKIRPSLVERFGLFVIIVLGEIIIGVVRGLAKQHHLDISVVLVAVTALVMGFLLWVLYFDFISHRIPKPNTGARMTWLYFHLILAMSIAMIGASLINFVEHPGDHVSFGLRYLLSFSIVLFLVSISVLMQTVQIMIENKKAYKRGFRVIFFIALIIALLSFFELEPIYFLLLVNLLLINPLLLAFGAWKRRLKRTL